MKSKIHEFVTLKNIVISKKNLYTLLLLITTIAAAHAQAQQSPAPAAFPSGEPLKTAGFTYNIIPAPNNTWCYDILKDGNLFIHQPSIPGMPGHNGFKTKEQAAKVAQLVITKMKQGEMPPTVSEEELKKLNVIHSSTN